MKRWILSACCLALLVSGLSVSAVADTIILGPVDDSTNPVANGVYVGPYAATWNGSPVQMVCDDYRHEVFVGEVWQAHASTFADLSHTRFWDSANPGQSLKNYQMAAWLTAQIFLNPQSAWGDISFAIWRIFAGSAPNVGSSGYWLNLAAGQIANYDFSHFRILTPNDSGSSSAQEYIVIVAPEPATMLLLVLGLLALCLVGRRRAAFSLMG